MKKTVSVLLAIVLISLSSIGVCATDIPYEKKEVAIEKTEVCVTAEKTAVYEQASREAAVLLTAKEGKTLAVTAHTKSFWKIEYRLAKENLARSGYVLKEDTDQPESIVKKAEPGQSEAAGAGETTQATPSEGANTPAPQAQAESSQQAAPQGRTVYWVANGQVYHTTSSCSTLRRSSNIRSGTIAESGKPRACKVCG